ncbi:MAG: phosphoribosylaminoimidazolesuccinocarboxamide synthase [Flavobacteriales bacterium]
MTQTLTDLRFVFRGQIPHGHQQGKVRDMYRIGTSHVVMVVSDRISAFDRVFPEGVPYKGQVLNGVAAEFLEATRDIVPNWMEAVPDPNVMVGKACDPLPVEMIVRGHLAGHAWREYQKGVRELCGVPLPDGLRKNDPLPELVITPTTKAAEGHDEDVTPQEIVEQGVLSKELYEELAEYALKLFARGSEMARNKGLILVDTKYEFGLLNGHPILIDEVHTPDSSRYFYAEAYEDKQKRGEEQEQLSKEFVREKLMEDGFQGEGELPRLSEAFLEEISLRYRTLYERLTDKSFVPGDTSDLEGRISSNVNAYLEEKGF